MKAFNRKLIFLMFAILLLCVLSVVIFEYESYKQQPASLFSDSSKEFLQPKEMKIKESENNSNSLINLNQVIQTLKGK